MKMGKIIFTAVAVAACTFIAGQAFARSDVYFKAPIKFRGTGCPAGSYTVSGEGTDTMTILFEKYDAAKPKENAASGMMRTGCSFVVPVSVPQGFQVSNLTSDWRGYAEGRTKLRREYFFAGQRGPSKTSSPRGDYVERDNLMHATWSKCGRGEVPMRVNSSIRAEGNPSYITLDKMMNFRITWRKCR